MLFRSPPSPNSANPQLPYQNGQLWPYLKSIPVYWCPADKINASGSTYPLRQNKLSTYVMNGAACGYAGRNPPYKLTSVQKLGVLFLEPNDRDASGNYIGGSYNDGSNYPNASEGPSNLHFPGSVLLYTDAHAEFIKRTAAINAMGAPGPNEFWWN